MSDSISKYRELELDESFTPSTPNVRNTLLIAELFQAAKKANIMDIFIIKAERISRNAPLLTPVVVFQIAADEARIEELCN